MFTEDEKLLEVTLKNGDRVNVYATTYMDNGNTAVILEDVEGYPYVDISINIGNNLKAGEFVLNHDVKQGDDSDYAPLFDKILDKEFKGQTVHYGFATSQVFKLKDEYILQALKDAKK